MKKLIVTALIAFIVIVGTANAAFAQHSVALGWNWTQGSGDPATGFIIQRGTTTGGPYTTICGGSGQPTCPPLAQLSYVDSTVTAGSTYFYVVEANRPRRCLEPF